MTPSVIKFGSSGSRCKNPEGPLTLVVPPLGGMPPKGGTASGRFTTLAPRTGRASKFPSVAPAACARDASRAVSPATPSTFPGIRRSVAQPGLGPRPDAQGSQRSLAAWTIGPTRPRPFAAVAPGPVHLQQRRTAHALSSPRARRTPCATRPALDAACLLSHRRHAPATDPQIALPVGVARVGRRQPREDLMSRPKGSQRRGEVAPREVYVTDFSLGEREAALPAGVARVG